MILATRCLAERALDGVAVRDALAATGLDEVLLSARKGLSVADLRGVPAVGVHASWADRGEAVAVARAAGADRLVLDLPASADLDAACRGLFELARSQPGLRLAVTTPAEGPLASPEPLALVLEDLAAQDVGYWHRPATAHVLGQGDVPWVDRLRLRLRGVLLDDVRDGEAGLPPGLGELDLRPAAELAGRSLDVALDVDPVPDVALLRVAVDSLHRLGFP